MAKNPLLDKVLKLREQLAEAEQALNDDIEARKAELDAELREAGVGAFKKARKFSSTRICKTCGKSGHNSRTCPEKGKKKSDKSE